MRALHPSTGRLRELASGWSLPQTLAQGPLVWASLKSSSFPFEVQWAPCGARSPEGVRTYVAVVPTSSNEELSVGEDEESGLTGAMWSCEALLLGGDPDASWSKRSRTGVSVSARRPATVATPARWTETCRTERSSRSWGPCHLVEAVIETGGRAALASHTGLEATGSLPARFGASTLLSLVRTNRCTPMSGILLYFRFISAQPIRGLVYQQSPSLL